MFRRSIAYQNFKYFTDTRVGQELALRTKNYMNDINKKGPNSKSNFVTRFLTRRRAIDHMQIEVDGLIAQELHWSFEYLMKLWTAMVVTPVVVGLFMGTVAPTRFLVWFGIVSQTKYDQMWELAHWGWVLLGQAFVALVFYDLSVYWRYPVYKYIFAPIYRRLGLYRPAVAGTLNLKDLKSGAARRIVKEQLQQKPTPLGGPTAKGGFSSFISKPKTSASANVSSEPKITKQTTNPFGQGANKRK